MNVLLTMVDVTKSVSTGNRLLQLFCFSFYCYGVLTMFYFLCLKIFSPGNFSCVCNVGYELFTKNGTAGFHVVPTESGERDGDTYQRNKTCVPIMCPSLEAPENGVILSTKVLCINSFELWHILG